MLIDEANRRVTAGFREILGEVDEERWDLPALPNRPILGIRTHRAWAQRRDGTPGFTAEVPVSLELAHRGWRFELSGRIDGLTETPSRVVVEEVKSMTLEGGELRLLTASMFPAARLQLALYCYATALRLGRPVFGALVFCSIFSDEEHAVGVDWSMEDVDVLLRRRADEILDEHERRKRWLEVREAAAPVLPFPFPREREVQGLMRAELEEVLARGGSMLLEAPTGSGKTAVSLYTVLKRAFETGHRVLFATAKTSGQEAAAKALGLMRDQGAPISSVTLTARAKICPQPVVYCHPDYCPCARDHHEKLRRSAVVPQLLHDGLVGRTRLLDRGEALELCPFELGLELTTRADVVIGDLNYVFHPLVRIKRLFEDGKPQPLLLIVDEAHNLVGRARGYFSPSLSARLLRKVREHARGRAGRFGRRLETVAVDILVEMETWATDAGLGDLPEGRGPWEPDLEALRGWQQQLAQLLLDDPLRRTFRPAPGEEDEVLDAYRHLSHLISVLDTLDRGTFVPWVRRTPGDLAAGVLCLDASAQLRRYLGQFTSTVMMSATISPHVFYHDALGMPSDTVAASFPSPFPRENQGVFIADEVTTRYREREQHIPDVARLILEIAAIRVGSYAVFVPSYDYLTQLRRYLEGRDFELLVDDRSSSDLVRRALLRELALPLHATGLFGGAAGRLLLAVQGGSFAESVEWPAGVLQGIFVVGPGLPAVDFEQEQLRAYYEERYGDGFNHAYLWPGMTRVVQAAGRLVRRPEDVGIIVLLDERFRWRSYSQALPRHWYGDKVEELVVEDLPAAVRAFWRRHRGGGAAPAAEP